MTSGKVLFCHSFGRQGAALVLLLLLFGIRPASAEPINAAMVVDVSPAHVWVEPGQTFTAQIRVATGPPDLRIAWMQIHVHFDSPGQCYAVGPLSLHQPGGYIPSPSSTLSLDWGGDFGQSDGIFEFQYLSSVFPQKGSVSATGTISRHPIIVYGTPGETCVITPQVLKMRNEQGVDIAFLPVVHSATVHITGPIDTPTPTPTMGPTPTPTLAVSAAPMARDPAPGAPPEAVVLPRPLSEVMRQVETWEESARWERAVPGW